MIAGLVAALWAPTVAEADPVACLTVYYVRNSEPPHYIWDDCYVPTPWPAVTGDDGNCTTLTDNGVKRKLCVAYSVTVPN